MKTKLALFATWLAAAASLAAAPLTATTAVQTRPDDAAPVVSYLKAGTEPTPAATAALANTPAGWMAVDLAGPFEAYVENKEIGKGLDVRPGASIYLQPKLDSGVLTTMEKGDKVEITGLRGKWTQVHVDKRTRWLHPSDRCRIEHRRRAGHRRQSRRARPGSARAGDLGSRESRPARADGQPRRQRLEFAAAALPGQIRLLQAPLRSAAPLRLPAQRRCRHGTHRRQQIAADLIAELKAEVAACPAASPASRSCASATIPPRSPT
jgi:hypothetical protein